jgi:hypothetical protein
MSLCVYIGVNGSIQEAVPKWENLHNIAAAMSPNLVTMFQNLPPLLNIKLPLTLKPYVGKYEKIRFDIL